MRELVHRVDRRDTLHLDGDPSAFLIAAHEVHGSDVGLPFTPVEPKPHLKDLRACG